jgi:uncharacterized protein YndB with AHSA1/START domain
MTEHTTTTRTTVTGDNVVITRVFNAPREIVFKCMVTPEHLTHFWGPVGMSTPLSGITIDLRPGGEFTTTMVNDADGTEYANTGVFVEIVEPELLSWTEPEFGMTTTSTFNDLGDGRTEVVITQSNVPEMFRSPEALEGFASSLERFDAYLATMP